MADGPNEVAIQVWNTILFEKFSRFRHLLTVGLAQLGVHALERHPPENGARVLDLGCGFGDSTIDIARRVGAEGRAIGVDCSENFVAVGRTEAEAANVGNAEFLARDVQTEELGGPYDYVFSRFGTMFFVSPVAALRNVRKSMRTGASLTMVVWRRREDNSWLYLAEQRVKALLPPRHDPDAATCGPGPFSMSGADLVSDQLLAAGYSGISFERLDEAICIGRTLEEAVEFAMALGPAGEALRLAGVDAENKRPEVIRVLREVLSEFARADGVWGPSSTWIVRATA